MSEHHEFILNPNVSSIMAMFSRVIGVMLLISAVYPVSLDTWGFALTAVLIVFFSALWFSRGWWRHWIPDLPAKIQIQHILLLALLLRVWVLCCCDLTQISDYHDFNQIARAMLQGGAWFDPGRPPGISWLTAACYAIAGEHLLVPLLMNIFISLCSIFVVWKGANLLFNGTVALWGALLLALYPEHIIHANYLCSEPGYFLGMNAGILFYVLSVKQPDHKNVFLALSGLFLGIGHYFRSTTPLVFVSIALAEGVLLLQTTPAQRPSFRPALTRLTGLVVAFLLVISPIIWHNRQNLGIWNISSYQMGGWSMYLATNPVYLGNWNAEDVAFFDSLCTVHPPPAAQNGYLYRDSLSKHLAWKRFKTHPGTYFASVLLFKPYCLWGDPSGSFWVNQQFSPGTLAARFFGLWLVVWHKLILCAAGLALFRAKRLDSRYVFPLMAHIYLFFAIFNTLAFSVMGTEGRYHNVLLGWLCWWAAVTIRRR